jgi:hypothetical protein
MWVLVFILANVGMYIGEPSVFICGATIRCLYFLKTPPCHGTIPEYQVRFSGDKTRAYDAIGIVHHAPAAPLPKSLVLVVGKRGVGLTRVRGLTLKRTVRPVLSIVLGREIGNRPFHHCHTEE